MAGVYRRKRDFEGAFVFALFKRSSDPLDFPRNDVAAGLNERGSAATTRL